MGCSDDTGWHSLVVGLFSFTSASNHADEDFRGLSSLGALVTLLSLAMDAFTQQITGLEDNRVMTDGKAIAQVQWFYFNTNTTRTSEQTAAYSAIFGDSGFTTPFSCPSGDCSWDPYETLGVCHQCADITSYLEYYDSCFSHHRSNCSVSLPNGPGIQFASRKRNFDYPSGWWRNSTMINTTGNGDLFNISDVSLALVNLTRLYLEPDEDVYRKLFETSACDHAQPPDRGKRSNSSALDCRSDIQKLFKASECSLYWCVRQCAANVRLGKLEETFLPLSWWNTTIPEFSNARFGGIETYQLMPSRNDWKARYPTQSLIDPTKNNTVNPISTTIQPEPKFVERSSHENLSEWLYSLFDATFPLGTFLPCPEVTVEQQRSPISSVTRRT